MERRFQTKDELEHFDFEDAVLEEVECACGRVKVMIDNVKILPDNSMTVISVRCGRIRWRLSL